VQVKTTAEKVLGKWGVTSGVMNEFYSNLPHINTVNGLPTDYFDFKTNGKVHVKISFSLTIDTVSYVILNDSTISLEGELNKIKELTNTKFVLYTKDLISSVPLAYDEFTINLKK
jgi:hypothetical protein